MYISIRTYRVGKGSIDDVMHRVDRDLAEAFAQEPGFISYHVAQTGERMVASTTLFAERELQILAMIAEGRSNAAIADELVVTKRAVERHINAIFLKLGLREDEDVSRRVKAALLYLADQR